MEMNYNGSERRQFVRSDCVTPLGYKVCSKDTISKLLQGYTSNVSQAGLLCSIDKKVNNDDILWLSFDRSILTTCEELEKNALIYQNGIIGKVVRAEQKENGDYDVGIQFITRQESNSTYIYPKIYFIEKNLGNYEENT